MFPIQQFADEIADSLLSYDVTVISSSTSSGKSVFVPIHAIKTLEQAVPQYTKKLHMIVTMPTVIAARRITQFQQERQSDITVDYEAGGHYYPKHCRPPQLVYTTAGHVVQQLLPCLLQTTFTLCDIIMIDEAHVQSRDNFVLVRLLRYRQLAHLPIPKIIITSATMDCEMFDTMFWNVNILSYDCPPYAITMVPIQSYSLNELKHPRFVWHPYQHYHVPGHVLIFCESARVVQEIVQNLSHQLGGEFDVLPLYSSMDNEEMELVLQRISSSNSKESKYFILVSTNMTESSVTIDNIVHVFDTQLEKVMRMNPITRLNELVVQRINNSSKYQRRGRTGRTCHGYYYADDYPLSDEVDTSEFERTNTAETVLLFAVHNNLPKIEDILFPTSAQMAKFNKDFWFQDNHLIGDVVSIVTTYSPDRVHTHQNNLNRKKCQDSRDELISRHMLNATTGDISAMGKFCPRIPFLSLNYSSWLFSMAFPTIYNEEISAINQHNRSSLIEA
jgi:pre-mRNA-splicing factor ATP-dependent RNA helicase DHX16